MTHFVKNNYYYNIVYKGTHEAGFINYNMA